jgi:hypothetical protein
MNTIPKRVSKTVVSSAKPISRAIHEKTKQEKAKKNIRSELSRLLANRYTEAGRDSIANTPNKGTRKASAALGKTRRTIDAPKMKRKHLKGRSKFLSFNKLDMIAIEAAAVTGTKDHL